MDDPGYTWTDVSGGQAETAEVMRVGVVLESWTVPAWTALMLRKVCELPSVRICALILHQGVHRKFSLKRMLSQCYWVLEKRLRPMALDAEKPVSIEDLFKGVESVTLRCYNGACPGPAMEALRGLTLDVLVNASPWTLRCGLATVARQGVLTTFFGTLAEEDSGAAGLWEMIQGDVAMVSGVQLLRPDQTTAKVYQSTAKTDSFSLRSSLNGVFWKSASFISRVLVGKSMEGNHTEEEGRSVLTRSDRQSRSIHAGGVLLQHASRYLAQRMQDFRSFEQWTLLLYRGNEPIPPLAACIPVTPPADRFWADPFVVQHDDQHYVFLEEFQYAQGRAHISVMAVHPDGTWEQPVPVLSRPYHLSYPFLFEWEGCLYMIPESAEHRNVELYRCREFPYRWEFTGVLLEGVQAYDTTLCEHEGTWWMFTNIVENRGGSKHDELFLFYAPLPLPGEWQAHARNPVLSDVRRARSAGAIYRHANNLYRPAQDCSRRYGYGIGIYRVDELTPLTYRETGVARVTPDGSSFKGIHTLNRAPGLTVMDAIIRRHGVRQMLNRGALFIVTHPFVLSSTE